MTVGWHYNLPVKKTFVALAFVALLGVALWQLSRPGEEAPDISFQTLTGETLALRTMRGGPVLVVFWATTCAVCIEDIPALQALYGDLAPRGLQFVAVAMPYDPPNRVVTLTEAMALPYPISLDVNGEITGAFGDIRYTPSAVLVGPDGRIEQQVVGRFDMTALRDAIEVMLPRAPGV